MPPSNSLPEPPTQPCELDEAAIASRLRHQPPLRLVERASLHDDGHFVGWARVRSHWPTAAEGTVRSVVLAELLAQSAGLVAASTPTGNDAIPLLLAFRTVELRVSRVRVGTEVRAEGRVRQLRGGLMAIEGAVWAGDQELCRAEAQAGWTPRRVDG